MALFVVAFAVSACGLPRPGPNKREIFAGSVQQKGNAYIVSVNDRVVQATADAPNAGFDAAFLNAGRIGADTIRRGDRLLLTVYENVEEGLFGTAGAPSTLTELQVDQTGHIFIPYAGRIRAAGNTPEALRQIITRKLDAQTPDPQFIVTRAAGDGSTVSIVGAGGQGVYPIEASTSTLSTMIAAAGGITTNPENTRVTVIRGEHKGTVWLEDLFSSNRQDIALRPGDRILIQEDTRRFTALGATGSQSLVEFPQPNMNAIEAIAFMGGLNSSLADPTGIFIFRDESPEYANRVLGRNDFTTPKRFAYVLDLTEPTGVFLGRDFEIRDGDTIYVTEAPYVQWTKTLSVLTSSAGAANSLTAAAGG
ncbi:polysaccharide biosynthesis/export family protein [Neptunicoccus sediminis]|uniref:polysaccharide biosynthesis/export family protein n=1 Tax=Neptunicoccus sediminis TaxID=1892596 RepID=UPI000845CED8|nr:polysaccharide biosynthesis/export family protein [Neptunicoccus sediminis]